ncbi:MAG: 3-hydroxyacyl-CoA dehydrogenase NAD-binding domain-containing protein [Promethearchaeota archaeon]
MDIKNVVVIGAGLMGSGIAQCALMAGNNVVLVDIKDEFINKGVASINKGITKLESKNKLGGLTAADVLSRLKTSLNIAEAVKDADLIVEAVIENMDIKKSVFKTCADNAPAHTIIASNTSTMSISEMSENCGRPEKCIGIHFFNPAPLMKLIEVIAGAKSSDESMDIGVAWSKSLPCLRGPRYVARVLKDRPGFIANRVMSPGGIYTGWCHDKFYEKYKDLPFEEIPWIELAADMHNPAAPMNPFVLADYTGEDTGYHTRTYYAQTLHSDFKPGTVLSLMMEKKLLGQKTGRGFFDWSKGRPKLDFTNVKKAGIIDGSISIMISANEGCRILEEGVVKDYRVIDETIKAGFNFPFGIMEAATQNYAKWSQKLEEISEKIGKEYIKPCELFKSGKFTSYTG